MPFESEKQERYMWAKHPKIAKRWKGKYGSLLKKNAEKLEKANEKSINIKEMNAFKQLSLEKKASAIRDGLRTAVEDISRSGNPYYWITEIYDDSVIICGDGKHYKVEYGKNQDGSYWLKPKSEWTEVEQSWEKVDEMEDKEVSIKARTGRKGFAAWTTQMRSEFAKRGWTKRAKKFSSAVSTVAKHGRAAAKTLDWSQRTNLPYQATKLFARMVVGGVRSKVRREVAPYKAVARTARFVGKVGLAAGKRYGAHLRTTYTKKYNQFLNEGSAKKEVSMKARMGGRGGFASWSKAQRSAAAKKGWMGRARKIGGGIGRFAAGAALGATYTSGIRHGLLGNPTSLGTLSRVAASAGAGNLVAQSFAKPKSKTAKLSKLQQLGRSKLYRAGLVVGGIGGAFGVGGMRKIGGGIRRGATGAGQRARKKFSAIKFSIQSRRADKKLRGGPFDKWANDNLKEVGARNMITNKARGGGRGGFAAWSSQMRSEMAKKGWLKRARRAGGQARDGVKRFAKTAAAVQARNPFAKAAGKVGRAYVGAAKKTGEIYKKGMRSGGLPGAYARGYGRIAKLTGKVYKKGMRAGGVFSTAVQGARLYGAAARTTANIARNAIKRKELGGSLLVTKENGDYRWTAITSSGFKDRDGQIVTSKALQDDVDRWEANGRPDTPLRWWHVPISDDWSRGIELGKCDFRMVHGKSLIESGTFLTKEIAEAVYNNADKLKFSIGFRHAQTEPNADGEFNKISIFERSILPDKNASNLLVALL